MIKMIIVKVDKNLSDAFNSKNYDIKLKNKLKNKIDNVISILDIEEYKFAKNDEDCVYVFLGDYHTITIHQWGYNDSACRIGWNGKNCVLSVYKPDSDDRKIFQGKLLINEFIDNWAENFIASYLTPDAVKPLSKKISNTSMTKSDVISLVASGKLSRTEFGQLCAELEKGTYKEKIGGVVKGEYSPWTVNPTLKMNVNTSAESLLFNYNATHDLLCAEIGANFTRENLEILWSFVQKKKEANGWTIAIAAGLTIAAAVALFLGAKKKEEEEYEELDDKDEPMFLEVDEDLLEEFIL